MPGLSFLGLIFGGIGRALSAALDWLKRLSPAQLLCVALIIALAVVTLMLRGEKRHSSKVEHRLELALQANADACAATRLAAVNPKLDCARMPQQIKLLGESVAATKAALQVQNDAVAALAAKSAAQQASAAAAVAKAQTRAREALTAAQRLRASAGRKPADPCKPSKDLEELWK